MITNAQGVFFYIYVIQHHIDVKKPTNITE